MKSRPLLSVDQVLDDETGIWANDLCDFSIHCGPLNSFLKAYGESGAKEICKYLDHLKKEVMENYLPEALKERNGPLERTERKANEI